MPENSQRLSRCEVRDHINCRKNDRWRSHRFYRALQRLKSPMRYICESFGAPRFSSFSTQSANKTSRPFTRFVIASVQDLPAPAALAKPAIASLEPSEQNIRSKCQDVLAVGFFLQRQARLASTHRVTSPFPGSLHPKIHHIHRPADFRDVYAAIGLDSRPYDAISDVFLARGEMVHDTLLCDTLP